MRSLDHTSIQNCLRDECIFCFCCGNFLELVVPSVTNKVDDSGGFVCTFEDTGVLLGLNMCFILWKAALNSNN